MKKQTEYDEQVTIFQWAELMSGKYPQLKFMYGSLNGVRLTIGSAVKAKRAGMNKGFPDIFLPWPNKKNNGLFIELKIGNNKPSPEQVEYLNFLQSNGYSAHVCYGSEETINIIIDYLESII